MNKFKQINWRKVLSTTAWIVVSCCTLVLLISAVYKTNNRKCKGINIRIDGVSSNYFIDESDIKKLIDTYCGAQTKGRAVSQFDLRSVEQSLEKDIWVKNAELFFDINGVLQVEVNEREPIARVFTKTGGSFYIDSSMKILPLSEKFSARVPVFTGFPTDTRILSSREKEMLVGVRNISEALSRDSFLMAMIDQVEITDNSRFELYPKLGDQVVLFGDASNHEAKFHKLKLFYKKIMPQAGWNKYSFINLSYENQVVAKIRSKEEVVTDSLRTLELMKMVAEYTEKMAGDTLFTMPEVEEKGQDLSMVLQSVQREESSEINLIGLDDEDEHTDKIISVTPAVKVEKSRALAKPPIKTEVKKLPVKKAETKKKPVTPVVTKPKIKPKPTVPKSVMKKAEPQKPGNDY